MVFEKNNIQKNIKICLVTAFFVVGFFVFSAHASAATPVYYSVGQSSSDLKTGTPTLTITAGSGTFSAAQTGNIGVGDRVTYNTNQIAYIGAKTNSDGMHWSLVTATGGIPSDVTNATVNSITHEFTSLSAAVTAASNAQHVNNTDLVAANVVLNIPCYYDSGADTTAVTVSGYTTGANNYIKIYTPSNTSTEANNSQRHSGKWDDGKYNITYSGNSYGIDVFNDNVIIDGLQLDWTINRTSRYAVYMNGINEGVVLKNNIISVNSNYDTDGVSANTVGAAGIGKIKIFNNIIYKKSGIGSLTGISTTSPGSGNYNLFYNNTVTGFTTCFATGLDDAISKNNVAQNCSDGYSGGWGAASDYNISNIAADAPGANSKNSTTVKFADAANRDFHLDPSDTAAKNAGADLSADVNLIITTDIDGQTRPTGANTVDIGADEGATQIYRSVGPGATGILESDSSHARTVILTSGVATFSNALADSIGVGDAVLIDTNSDNAITSADTLVFIHGRTDSTHYILRTHTGSVPSDITSNDTYQIYRAHTSLSNAEAGTKNTSIPITFNGGNRDLVSDNEQWNIACYANGTTADTTGTTINGWITSAQNFIKVYTPTVSSEVGINQRHGGKWDDGKYNIVAASSGIINYLNYTRLDGLQIKFGSNVTSDASGIKLNGLNVASSIFISNNIIRGDTSKTYYYSAIYDYSGSDLVTSYIWNNILYDNAYGGINISPYCVGGCLAKSYIYNNTVYNSVSTGIRSRLSDGKTIVAKNNIVQNCVDGFSGTFDASSNYNISNLAADAPGANSKNSTNVQFADVANKDFHLSSTDTAAKNVGADLSADSSLAFNIDIDGQTRPSSSNATWDIGADEAATPIYYSVGQNTTDHKTGSPTVTVSGGTATFSVAQTAANMGVGDVLTYDSTNKCYLSEKISQTVWKCITATGGVPASLNNVPVNSITHAFSSLNAAVTGASGASYLNTSDLVMGNYQLNIPCYYDSGADTAVVIVQNYTTGISNYIKIYTPNNISTEVNNSQRHSGKWDDGKYNMTVAREYGYALPVRQEYTQVVGLQVRQTTVTNGYGGIQAGNSASMHNVLVDSCIVTGSGGTSSESNAAGIYVGFGGKVRNSVVYNMPKSGIFFTYSSSYPMYAYNSTVYGNGTYGINSSGGAVFVKNNISVGNASGDYVGTFDSSMNNISQDSTSPDASYRNKTVAFANLANKDFHLSPTDTAAKNAGADLSADANFALNTDIDGQIRPNGTSWNIGADEAANNVFYSVGQSSSDLKTGTPTVTIANGTATFSIAQTGNIGVGDRVTYNTSSIAYIASKIDQSNWKLVTATGAAPADVSTQTVNSITREFTSLSAAVTAASNASHINNTDLTAANVVLNLPCYYDSGADTTAVTVSGYTTGANNYIKIYTPFNTSTEANNSQRHQGKWDDGKYNIFVSLVFAPITVGAGDVRIEGLQFKRISVYANGVVYSSSINGGERVISSSIILSTAVTGNNSGISVPYLTNANYKYLIENNILIGGGHAVDLNYNGGYASVFIYNNTAINTPYFAFRGQDAYVRNLAMHDVGYYMDSGGPQMPTVSKTSNIVSSKTLGFNVSGFASVFENKAVNFSDVTGSDFHLDPDDTGAKNSGVDLGMNPDGAFRSPSSFDIDGQTRSGSWDIGADEGATAVYYSVGQNTNDHKTGTPTLTISGGVGTFSEAQTATNMGVGDKVTYSTSSVAYISAKISQTQWKLITATGGIPADATSQTVNSIAHAFPSLSSAVSGVSGASGASYLNTNDLKTNNYQLNIPCYYDSGPDTINITTYFKTAASNYLKIYTPFDTASEVNLSQRHSGKWDDAKFSIVSSSSRVIFGSDDMKIDGLQIHNSATSGSFNYGIRFDNAGEVHLSNLIIRGDPATTGNNAKGMAIGSGVRGAVFKVWNNIVYDIKGTSSAAISMSSSLPKYYAYNNITYNSVIGYNQGNSSVVVLKNNIANGNTTDYSGTFDASSINNISQDATSPNTALRNKTVTFVDATNKNFHLASTDTAAKGAGANLQNDSFLHFSQDIDGQERSGNWDIGADQFDSGSVNSPDVQSDNISNGLVGHWTFDGQDTDWSAASGQIKDSSGNGNNGTISGLTKTSVADGKLGQGMRFNGTSDYIYNTSIIPAMTGNTEGTISTWLKSSTNCGTASDLINFGDGSANYLLVLRIDCTLGRVQVILKNASTDLYRAYITPVNLQDNNWHSFIIKADSSGNKIYWDGQQQSPVYSSGAATNTEWFDDVIGENQLRIGGSLLSVPNYFKGMLDDVRVYNRALLANEITALYKSGQATMQKNIKGNTNGLVGYWSFDGPTISGTAVADQSGLGNNGTISGATVADGKVGQGMGFDGTSSYMQINDTGTNLSADYVTMSAWIKPNDLTGSKNIVSRLNTSYRLKLVNQYPWAYFNNGTATDFKQSTLSVNANQWQHVVVVYSSGQITFYVNGVSDSKVTTVTGMLAEPSQNLYIGAYTPGQEIFNGSIDEVRIFNRALSAQEIGDLYNTGKVQIKK